MLKQGHIHNTIVVIYTNISQRYMYCNSFQLDLRLVVEGHGQMRVSCHVPVPDHMILINKAEKTEPVTATLKRMEVILTYKYPVEAVSPFDYFCNVYDEYGNHKTRHTHRLSR